MYLSAEIAQAHVNDLLRQAEVARKVRGDRIKQKFALPTGQPRIVTLPEPLQAQVSEPQAADFQAFATQPVEIREHLSAGAQR